MKSRVFLQQQATAIYFYDLTSHIKSLQLNDTLSKAQQESKSCLLVRLSTLHMDFRGPLHDSLLIIDVLIKDIANEFIQRNL